jgi:hypothetical protein
MAACSWCGRALFFAGGEAAFAPTPEIHLLPTWKLAMPPGSVGAGDRPPHVQTPAAMSNRTLIALAVLLWVLHVVLSVVQRLASPEV